MEEQEEGEGEVKAAVITESSDVKEWGHYVWGSHFPVCAGFLGFRLFLTPFLSLLINSTLGWVGGEVSATYATRFWSLGAAEHPWMVGFGGDNPHLSMLGFGGITQHPCMVGFEGSPSISACWGLGGDPASLDGGVWGNNPHLSMLGFRG